MICYGGRQLKAHEKNYPTYDLELAAIVFALNSWRHYLLGERFELYTDHKSLKYLFSQKEINLRQQIWMEFFASYDFEIAYTPGKGNVVAGTLSRKKLTLSPLFVERQSLEYISSFDFRPSVDYVPGLLASLEVQPTLLGRVGEAQRNDPHLVEIVGKLMRGESSRHLDRYAIDERGWLRRDGRLCVPQDESLKKAILEDSHRSKMTIHPGGDKMYRDMKQVFFWARMKKDVVEFVARCLVFQQVKAEQKNPGGFLHPLEIPLWKWESVSMDFVDVLPRSRKGNTGIWVIVDRLTKSAHFVSIKSRRTAALLASV